MTREEAINNLKKVLGFSPTYDKAFYTLFPNGAESSLSPDVDEAAIDFADFARKQPKDYAIAAIADYDHGCIDGFKAGAEWQRAKMLKNAVEGYVLESSNPAMKIGEKPKPLITLLYEETNENYVVGGDKVIVQIRKKEEQK